MDWAPRSHSLSESARGSFRYGEGRCTVLRKLVLDEKVQTWDIHSEAEWNEWLEKDRFLCEGVESAGLIVLLCSRRPTDFDGPSYLPFSADAFVGISQKFHIPETTARTISRGDTYFSRSICTDEGGVERDRILYTARTSKQWENDIALSATHFPDLGLTVAVVYGCSEDQLDEFGRRVRKGAAYVEHPMLVVGIFAELERQRLKEKIEDLVDGFVMGTDSMNVETRSIREVMNADGERVSDILDIYNDARNFLKGLSAVKLQLRKMIKHVSELDHAGKRGRKSRGGEGERVRRGRVRDTGELIRERLVEISEEHDASIEDCRMVMEDIPIHAQMVLGRIGRQQAETNTSLARTNTMIAEETKRDNSQMKALAALTTLYLPLSTVSSIFSMGVFNWSPDGSQGVVSIYFWIFVVVAATLTMVTGGLWCLITRPWESRKVKRAASFDVGKMV